MRVIDLQDEHKELYFKCLEDWSAEIEEAGSHKARWYERMKEKGLRVKLALDDAGTVGGMIQYAPIEHATAVEGVGLYFVFCIWVHGHKQGRGNLQKKGMGTALLSCAEEDARRLGAKGMVVWGMVLPFFMRASWFIKHGYRKVDRDGIVALLWKPFTADAGAPRLMRLKKKPQPRQGTVEVTALVNGWCPAMNMTCERARRACTELGDGAVVFRQIDTFDRATLHDWGVSDALFIDGTLVRTGPPPSYEKIKKLIAKRRKQLRLPG